MFVCMCVCVCVCEGIVIRRSSHQRVSPRLHKARRRGGDAMEMIMNGGEGGEDVDGGDDVSDEQEMRDHH